MRKFDWILFGLLAAPLCAQVIDLSKVPGAKLMIPVEDQSSGFRDSLYYTSEAIASLVTQEELITKSEAQIRNLIIARLNSKAATDATTRIENWKAFVAEQSNKPPVVLTKEQLQENTKAQAESLSTQVTALVAAKPTAEEVSELKAKLQAVIDELSRVIVKPVAEEEVVPE